LQKTLTFRKALQKNDMLVRSYGVPRRLARTHIGGRQNLVSFRSICCTPSRNDTSGINRYSRTVTRPKDQGASQVIIPISLPPNMSTHLKTENIHPSRFRQCFMLRTAFRMIPTSTKPWSASAVFGEFLFRIVLWGFIQLSLIRAPTHRYEGNP
jgi:hypothetical protein